MNDLDVSEAIDLVSSVVGGAVCAVLAVFAVFLAAALI